MEFSRNLVDVGPIVQSFVLYCVLIRQGDCFTTFLTVCECRRLDWFPKLIFLCFLSSCSEIRYIFFFKSFRKGLLMIYVHKTIVEIQNPEIISVCGLVCSINYRWLSHTQKSLLFSNLSHLTPLHQSMCRFKFWSLKYL